MSAFKRKHSKSRNRLIMAGILTAALTCATGVTATFAWFSLEPFNAGPRVNVSLDEKNGTAELTMKRLDTTKDKAVLDPVTSAGSFVRGNHPVLKTAPRMRSESGEAQQGSYLTMEYQFTCTQDCWITLGQGSRIVPNESQNAEISENPELLNQAVHAVRVRFTSWSNPDHDYITRPTPLRPKAEAEDGEMEVMEREKGEDVYFGGRADMMPYDGFYDNDGEKEYCYGFKDESKLSDYYLNKKGTATEGKKAGNFRDAVSKDGIWIFDEATAIKDGYISKEPCHDFAELIPAEGFEGQLPDEDLFLLDLKAGEAQTLTVTVYVEGWDPYCTNDIGNASMTLDLVFTGLAH